MRLEPLITLNDAKRSLGREVRMLEGFIGVGIGGTDIIRLYVRDRKTPVVRYVESNYGNHYAGYLLSIVETPGFRAGLSTRGVSSA
ncbi:MAG: hypothetical protein OXR71_03420 [Gemmatimonadota bacterium]|nr:hypothetical protein [Gemmatimonadota bacterium]